MSQEILTAIAKLDEKTTAATKAISEVGSEVAAFRKETNQRFEGMEQRFEGMEQRFDKLESEVSDGFEKLDGRMVSLEAQVEALKENKEWE